MRTTLSGLPKEQSLVLPFTWQYARALIRGRPIQILSKLGAPHDWSVTDETP